MQRVPLSLGVLVSGSGSNLQALLDAIADGRLHAEIRVVISNKPDVYALTRAQARGVPIAVIPHGSFASRETFEAALLDTLHAHGVEWVALAGFMRVLTGHFLRGMNFQVVNVHPALLPSFPGTHGPRQALEKGVRLTGATVHLVDEGVDTGPILVQGAVPVLEEDTEATLHQRIQQVEHQIFPRALQLIAEGRVQRQGGRLRLDLSERPLPPPLIFP